MTDRELIEAAAKAAKIPGGWNERDDGWFVPGGNEGWLWLSRWDPLNDDKDAFRLAVKLGLRHLFYVEVQKDCVQTSYIVPQEDVFYESFKDQDPCAATRRAIVRAAAELGKQA